MPAKRTMPRVCERCGADFLVRPDQARKGWGRYCSRDCNSKFWHQVVKSDTCWEWQGDHTANGYGRLTVRGQRVVAHRHSWEMHFGPIPDGMIVCHHCDNPPCIRPDHLFLGSHQDNMADAANKGRMRQGALRRLIDHPGAVLRGSDCPWAKLTEAQVQELRSRYAAGGITQKQLAEDYALHPMTVFQIIHRLRWDHLD